MRMLRTLLICLLYLSGQGFAQETEWLEKKRLEVKTGQVYLDPLNNIYALRNGEVLKLDHSGKELARYSNKQIGDLVKLDVSNPMKVLLFSADQMRIIFLDSRLSELRQDLDLFKEGYEQISLAATSHSNGFWLYDPINFRLIRYDQALKKERESLNLGQHLRLELYPTDLVEAGNHVYMTDPRHGIFVFDIYGNYLRKLPLHGQTRLRIHDGRLFYVKGGMCYALHLQDLSEELVWTSESFGLDYDISRTRLASVYRDGIIIYEPKR
jgi:hypothetical protein